MKVILISGKAQDGKDTCGNFLDIELRAKGFSTQIMHFGDAVKYVCEKYYNWDGNKDERGRSILQTVGTEIVRRQDEHFWTDFVGRLARTFDCDYIIIPDWRFENELFSMRTRFSYSIVVPVLITRPENEKTDNMTDAQRNHQSETELDNWKFFDYNIINEFGKLDATKEQLIAMIDREETLWND